MKVHVCSSCTHDGAFVKTVQDALADCDVLSVDCMSGCAHAQTVAFHSAGKTAYLFGDITVDDLPALQNFARLYQASSDGNFTDARVLGDLRTKAIARIPG
ncbi:Protein of unknown function [Sulfitobacter brevis]|uniref:Metal-binding protein n=1 Tax=Sulfitobacter brevis TaxID=74348 RepID=A0A1I1VWX5_9RHOB|nr:DUF1636 family protein [Sulfitobacter brevis]SFD87467.1 Protein of unknown function [Sulfitobacter brevis]